MYPMWFVACILLWCMVPPPYIMYYVYILKSKLDRKLYIGYTTDLKERFRKHQNGEVAAAIGALLGIIIVVLLGEHVQSWLLRRYRRENKDKYHGRIYRIWVHYGVIGLGLLAPLLTGAPLGTAIGIALGAPIDRLLFWMGLGIVLWSAVLTFICDLGMVGIQALKH